MASECRMKISLRVKKYLKVTSFLSSRMTGLAACSQGRRMLAPKLISGPAPSWPACMMPPPAPVMTMKPAWAILRPNSTACWYSGRDGRVRAEPNMVTLRTPRIGGKEPEGVAQLAKRGLNHAHVAAVLHVREQLQRVLDNIGDILRV